MKRTIGVCGLAILAAGAASASTTKYVYDELGRLTVAIYNDSNGDETCDATETCITYAYDAAGNRTSVVVASDGLSGGAGSVVVVPLNGFTVIPLE